MKEFNSYSLSPQFSPSNVSSEKSFLHKKVDGSGKSFIAKFSELQSFMAISPKYASSNFIYVLLVDRLISSPFSFVGKNEVKIPDLESDCYPSLDSFTFSKPTLTLMPARFFF